MKQNGERGERKDIKISFRNISVSSKAEILFSHIRDTPRLNSHNYHMHDYMELVVYVEGDADFIIGQNYLNLQRGTVILAGANVLHKTIVHSTREYERFYIGLPAAAFADMDRTANPLSCFHRGADFIALDGVSYELLLALLYRISELSGDMLKNGCAVYGCLLELLSVLNDAADRQELPGAGQHASLHEMTKRALELVERSGTEIPSVAELAARLHVSASYLSTLFSRDMNVTLKKYLTACRIAKSKIILSSGATVTDAGYACGFCSTSHFITCFKSITGMTPNKYRAGI